MIGHTVKVRILPIVSVLAGNPLVTQWNRVSGFYPLSRGFESLQADHIWTKHSGLCKCFLNIRPWVRIPPFSPYKTDLIPAA
jgi:hypothetical protein